MYTLIWWNSIYRIYTCFSTNVKWNNNVNVFYNARELVMRGILRSASAASNKLSSYYLALNEENADISAAFHDSCKEYLRFSWTIDSDCYWSQLQAFEKTEMASVCFLEILESWRIVSVELNNHHWRYNSTRKAEAFFTSLVKSSGNISILCGQAK